MIENARSVENDPIKEIFCPGIQYENFHERGYWLYVIELVTEYLQLIFFL